METEILILGGIIVIMTENMTKFLEAVSKDEALKSELEAFMKDGNVKDEQALIEFAVKKGFTLTEDDFKQEESELSEDELQAVAGGGCAGLGCSWEAVTYCAGVFGALFGW